MIVNKLQLQQGLLQCCRDVLTDVNALNAARVGHLLNPDSASSGPTKAHVELQNQMQENDGAEILHAFSDRSSCHIS